MAQNVPEPRYVPPSRPGYTPPGEIKNLAESVRQEPVFPCCPVCGCKLPINPPDRAPFEATCPNCQARVHVEFAPAEKPNSGGSSAKA
ncbi:MAG TPA: hypothetical protein VFZ25_03015 [Chloroflexota bacterium]|nr:hypothetical protein [Chloroflexota bacterium]